MGTTPTVLAFDLGASSGRAFIGELIGGEAETAEPGESGGFHDGVRHAAGSVEAARSEAAGEIAENTGNGSSDRAAGASAGKRLRITEIHRFVNGPVQIGGHFHWDILMILQELKTAIRAAFRQGFSPASFGICTWGVDFGLLDENGELLGNPYHYRDPQTNGLIEEICGLEGEERLFRESGLQLMPFNTIYQLYAMKKAGSAKLAQARTLLLTPDLLNYFLTGHKGSEFTMATTTQLFLPDQRKWNAPLMERLGIPSSIFLDPVQPGTGIGELTEDVRAELQVPVMQAIAVGSHDTESAAAAVPSETEPFAYLVCGTWSLLGTERPEALLSEEARELHFSNEGGVGDTFQLLKNIMGLWIVQECKRGWDKKGENVSFADLANEAGEAEPFRSLIDPDDLRFMNPADMETEIRRFCEETGQPVPATRGATVRCILESLAIRYRFVLEQIERLTGSSFAGLHVVGGGIQNELLCQLTADAIGRPVWAGPVEASAIGNLLVQLQASGAIADREEGKAIVKRSFPMSRYEPSGQAGWAEAIAAYGRIASSV